MVVKISYSLQTLDGYCCVKTLLGLTFSLLSPAAVKPHFANYHYLVIGTCVPGWCSTKITESYFKSGGVKYTKLLVKDLAKLRAKH